MFGLLQNGLILIISIAALVGAVWGLIDAAQRPAPSFTAAGKWSKNVWLIILGVATVIAFLSMPRPIGTGGGIAGILGIAAVVAVVVYFVDVRPKLGQRGSGGGGATRGGSPGGW